MVLHRFGIPVIRGRREVLIAVIFCTWEPARMFDNRLHAEACR